MKSVKGNSVSLDPLIHKYKNNKMKGCCIVMPKMEVFFDYSCPFCLRGHSYLAELAPLHPEIEIIWQPCEAHPRPERGPHSDLMMQGMFYLLEIGGDIWKYHDIMYKAALNSRGSVDIEDIGMLASLIGDITDSIDFRHALISGKYAEIQQASNHHAYDESGVWAVPSFRMNGKKLDSAEGIGITREQLEEFMIQK